MLINQFKTVSKKVRGIFISDGFKRGCRQVFWGLYSLLQAFLISCFILFNPLGLKNTSQEQSELVYLDVTASSFDARLDSAVVVLIDEYTIESRNLTYPVDYHSLARILRAISGYNPNSIFIDILQSYPHSKDFDYWANTLKRVGKNHPVFLAQDLDFDKSWRLNDPNNARHKLSQSAILTPVSWRGEPNRYPLTINHNGEIYPTVAMTVYEEFCKTSDCKLFKSNEPHDEPMVVRWNNKYSDKQLDFLNVKDGCQSNQRTFIEAFEKHIVSTFQSKEDLAELRVQCPPILTLSASEFLEGNATDNQALRDVIRDRAVFIGYKLTGSSDLVTSPVHGQLDGVFFHAMAFVNLVSLDDDYWRSQNAIENCPIAKNCDFSRFDLLQALLQTVILGVSIYLKNHQYRDDSEVNAPTIGAFITFVLFSVIVCAVVLNIQEATGPANWIALTSITLISVSMLIKPMLIRWIQIKLSMLIRWIPKKLSKLSFGRSQNI
ncbi:TPA: CHASE2 domain-containing protein [Vibrio harveyi]|uniref:CHASE2 domain-containing protein n=1 Tax=Vibrio harveyi TaxID=669 RepID=UPI00390BCDA4